MNDTAALKYNLVFRRAKLRLSQAELAERAAIARALVFELEHGRATVPPDVLERLAIALEVNVAKLLAPVRRGAADADVIARRREDEPDAFVDGRDFLAALAELDEPPPDDGDGRPT